VAAAASLSRDQFRVLAAVSAIATSTIIGSALAGGDNGALSALIAQAAAQGPAGAPAAATADAASSGGPAIPPPPSVGGPSAPASSPQQTISTPPPVQQAPPAATADQTTTTDEPTTTPEEPTAEAGPVKHVWVISLASPGYDQTFGAESEMPYLSEKLRPQGELLSDYELLTANPLPNYLAMVSGQAPNKLTKNDCPTFDEFATGVLPDKYGLVDKPGCVYPVQALTVADQMVSSGNTWHAYMQDMANDFGPANCVHPAPGEAEEPVAGGYTVTHNPFAFFHSLLDLGACATNDVPFDGLKKDLSKPETTPAYSFISPNQCNAGVPGECPVGEDTGADRQTTTTTTLPAPTTTTEPTTDPATTTTEPTTTLPAPPTSDPTADGPAAAASADEFLSTWVPQIMKSAAYKKDGLIVITFGESHAPADAENPNQVGALLLSPFGTAGQTIGTPYTPHSLLRSVEDLFALTPLGYAGSPDTESFAPLLTGGGD
jgi:hypothetical protein